VDLTLIAAFMLKMALPEKQTTAIRAFRKAVRSNNKDAFKEACAAMVKCTEFATIDAVVAEYNRVVTGQAEQVESADANGSSAQA
jgi:hypothetical protein